MHIERELLNLGENISVALAPILVPVEELLRDPRDLQLLDTADERLNAGHPETAVVLAQTAVEVMADWALRVALRLSMPEGAVEPLLNVLPDRTFMDRRTRTVWTSLTGDVLSEMETWKSYHGHVERRNRVAPAGFQPTEEDARASIDVCERLVIHLQNVI
jgi:hypothetical protein